MAIDLTKPVFILATVQGDRLAVLGGSNDEDEARAASSMSSSIVLLRAIMADAPPRLNDDGSITYVLPS